MKLLIAEDEQTTRDGLLQCIPSIYTDIRTASNGQTAYELALEMEPDVVLCDIRMPKLNGIDLAQLLRKRFPSLHILFISGYADKEYLKAAIALQADGYLEKPIDEAELVHYLNRAADQVRARCKSRSDQARMAEHAGLFARRQLLHALLCSPENLDEALALNPTLAENFRNAEQYVTACICLAWADTMNTMLIDSAERRIIEILESCLPASMLCGALTTTRIGLVIYGERVPSGLLRNLEKALETAVQAEPSLLCACACIASPGSCLRELSRQYSACLNQAQWLVFAVGRGAAAWPLSPQALPLPEDHSARLNELLSSHDFDGAKELIVAQTREIARRQSGSIDSARKYFEVLLSVCLNAENVAQATQANTIQRLSILSAFARLRTLNELSHFILVHIDNLLPSITLPETTSDKMREVMDIVRKELSNPNLSVQSIASRMGLSENYLSALFRRETGQTLHKVIIELRLERAKYLLLKNYRLSDVAQKTGFSSANYFHSVFKKHVGLSPADFVRKQLKSPEDKP